MFTFESENGLLGAMEYRLLAGFADNLVGNLSSRRPRAAQTESEKAPHECMQRRLATTNQIVGLPLRVLKTARPLRHIGEWPAWGIGIMAWTLMAPTDWRRRIVKGLTRCAEAA
jgi:hypothetical protein